MDLHNLIIHKLIKRRRETDTKQVLADSTLPVDETAIDFVKSVRSVYSNKRTPQYGAFDVNKDSYPFQVMMEEYLDSDHDDTFVRFSHRALRHLDKEMSKKRMATGGYVVFAHFHSDNSEFILCLMVDDTEGFAVSEDLKLLEQVHLDIADLQIAARINVDSWTANDDRYVSFIPGSKDVSEYFQSFIGVKEPSSPRKDTRKAKEAIDAYVEEYSYTESEREDVYEDVGQYMKRSLNKGNAVTVKALSHIVDPEEPDRFRMHAVSDEYRVSGSFSPDRSVIKDIEKFKVESNGISIQFERSLFRSKVTYSVKTKVLSVNEVDVGDLSPDLQRELNLDQ